MKWFICMVCLLCATIASANGESYYQKAQEEFIKSTKDNAPIHITYAFHYLEKAAELGDTKAMFALGLFSYQRQGIVNKDIAMEWFDKYLASEGNPNPSFVAIIHSAKRELKVVKQKLEELISSDDIDSN